MRPVIGIVCDLVPDEGAPNHQAGDEYVQAVLHGAGALPLLAPVTNPPLPADEILAQCDGLLFTGALSNVAPALYGDAAPGTHPDPARDATALPLLRAAIASGTPVLCICRGFQELNVALGGTLHRHLHDIPGHLDHRAKEGPPDVQYAPAHGIAIAADGVLAQLTGARDAMVNSLHHQGIARLAPGLHADAVAPDGQIEAVSLPGATGFLLGVQWHPEWRWRENPLSAAIFTAFGKAATAHRAGR